MGKHQSSSSNAPRSAYRYIPFSPSLWSHVWPSLSLRTGRLRFSTGLLDWQPVPLYALTLACSGPTLDGVVLGSLRISTWHNSLNVTPCNTWSAYLAIAIGIICIIFIGFDTFVPWSTQGFITSYFSVAWAACLFIFWKVFKKTEFVDPKHADFISGKVAVENGKREDSRRTTELGCLNYQCGEGCGRRYGEANELSSWSRRPGNVLMWFRHIHWRK